MKNIEKYYEYYDEGTADDAEVVLILPGVSCGAFLFREALKYFLPKYKIVLFNNPGLNDTPIPAILTVEKITNIVNEVLEHLNIARCNVIGHSMGGFTAQQFSLNYPDKVKSLVLVSTSYGGPHTNEDAKRLTDTVGLDVVKYRKSGKDPAKSIKFVFSKKYQEEHKEEFKNFCKFYLANALDEYLTVRHFACGAQFSSYSTVHNIKNRTLVIHGNDDNLVSTKGSEKLAGRLPNSYFWELPECGHFPMIERDDFYPRIIDFFAGNNVGVDVPYELPPQDVDKHHNYDLFKTVMTTLFNK